MKSARKVEKKKITCGGNRPRLATPIHTNRTCDVRNYEQLGRTPRQTTACIEAIGGGGIKKEM